ncbi:toprim domain-containing protein [Comamonas granuli]|uniref:toprim domain-containing protein n=1 Tax=Comamonas granuli TaxID=290309 RepID=UPI000B1BAA41|nr:toprim domain-containing protein [Comamonas granuli]
MNKKIIDRHAVPVNDLRRACREFSSMFEAMRHVGLEPFKDIDLMPDGRLRRYRVRGDKPGSKNGWVVLHDQPVMAGAFGSWKTGITHTWRAGGNEPLTPAQHAELQRQFRAMQAARAAEQVAVHRAARERADRLWRAARPADDAHPYLRRKGIRGFGVRQLNGALVVPARDAAGALHTLQFIGADGSKRFLSGGRIQGCYYAMGRPGNRLLLAEGFATAATVFMATGDATACAFNAGNLMPVARALRAKFPHARIVVAADDDSQTPGNPGLTRATEAARAVGGFVAVPRFERGARHGV